MFVVATNITRKYVRMLDILRLGIDILMTFHSQLVNYKNVFPLEERSDCFPLFREKIWHFELGFNRLKSSIPILLDMRHFALADRFQL